MIISDKRLLLLLKPKDVSRDTGISLSIIKKIEKGNFRTIPRETFYKVIHRVGLNCSDIIYSLKVENYEAD